jgi:hypothetical protein
MVNPAAVYLAAIIFQTEQTLQIISERIGRGYRTEEFLDVLGSDLNTKEKFVSQADMDSENNFQYLWLLYFTYLVLRPFLEMLKFASGRKHGDLINLHLVWLHLKESDNQT